MEQNKTRELMEKMANKSTVTTNEQEDLGTADPGMPIEFFTNWMTSSKRKGADKVLQQASKILNTPESTLKIISNFKRYTDKDSAAWGKIFNDKDFKELSGERKPTGRPYPYYVFSDGSDKYIKFETWQFVQTLLVYTAGSSVDDIICSVGKGNILSSK